jgi:hypothetical protein
MCRSDVIRFYEATPLWFWPVLAWNLYWLLRRLDRMATDTSFLARITTDGRGRLRLQWVSRPERPDKLALARAGAPSPDLFDLDLISALMEGRGLFRAATLARAVSGRTLARLFLAAGACPPAEPEPG